MAQGQNASKRGGKDWWGKRPLSGHAVSNRSRINKFFKRLLHKRERQLGKSEIKTSEQGPLL